MERIGKIEVERRYGLKITHWTPRLLASCPVHALALNVAMVFSHIRRNWGGEEVINPRYISGFVIPDKIPTAVSIFSGIQYSTVPTPTVLVLSSPM